MSRIKWRISNGTVGRPLRDLDFQRQYALNPARCHRTRVSGLTIANASRTLGNSRHKPTKINRSVLLKAGLFGPVSPQNIDLLAQRQVLSLKRHPRSEQADQRPPDQFAKVPHRTTASPDSRSLTSRTRFPTGTAEGGAEKTRKLAKSTNFVVVARYSSLVIER